MWLNQSLSHVPRPNVRIQIVAEGVGYMKRIIIWSCVAALLVACGVGIAVAGARGCHRGHGWGRPVPLRYLARELDLSREQRQQIRSMWQMERPAILSLVHEFAAESKEMDAATAKGNLDRSEERRV